MSQLMRLWYLSHRRPAKAQVSLRIRTVSPEPSLFTHMKYQSRRRVLPKIRSSPTRWLRMRVWRKSLRRTKSTIISWDGSNYSQIIINYPPYPFLWSLKEITFEPSHEIMALFVLRKLILQTRMHSLPVELDVWFLVVPVVYFYTLCVRTAKALARLRRWAGSPEHPLVAYAISTIISWAGSFTNFSA